MKVADTCNKTDLYDLLGPDILVWYAFRVSAMVH